MKNNNENNRDENNEVSEHEQLCAYVLGELNERQAQAMEARLANSEELRIERVRLEATIGLVAEFGSKEESLSPSMMEALEQAATPPPVLAPARPSWYQAAPVRMAAGLVAIVSGVAAGLVLMKPENGTLVREPRQESLAQLEKPNVEDAETRARRSAAVQSPLQANNAPADKRQKERESEGLVKSKKPQPTPPATVAPAQADSSKGSIPQMATGALQDRSTKAYTTNSRNYQLPFGGGSVNQNGPSGPAAAGAPATGFLPASNAKAARTVSVASNTQGLKQPGYTWKDSGLSRLSATTPSTGGGEQMEMLRSMGYVSVPDSEDGGENLSDFFLGHGVRGSDDDRARRRKETVEQRAERILQGCYRLPNETPRDMFYRFWGDNSFELAQLDNLSTFSADVDTASYALARRYLMGGNLPSKAQVRTEEFLNYFKADLPAPTEGTFSIHTELSQSRYGQSDHVEGERSMLRVGIRGKDVPREERKALALTFVVDTSGSMKEGQRMELVKHALRLLVTQLDAADSIAIVGFNNSAQVVMPMTSVQSRSVIEAAIFGLRPGGGTNAEGGLVLGYEVAAAALTSQAHNRVVFLSDGVANVGQVDQDRINADVKQRRESGIYLNTIGVGMSNHNDNFLEQLANKGDGLCNYVDSPAEARRALVENFTGAFETIARDVKIQVEFDARQVYRYRLLGYENRAIADADFRNDAVDAGEVGAGHQVVALYELELTGVQSTEPMAKVNLRWKAPVGAGRDPLEDSATEISTTVMAKSSQAWSGTSAGYKRAVMVAQFAEFLRRSIHARGDSLDGLLADARMLSTRDRSPDFVEFVGLLERSHRLIVAMAPESTDLTDCVDALRRNRLLRAQVEDLQKTNNGAVLEQLESSNLELEAKIRDLIRAELRK